MNHHFQFYIDVVGACNLRCPSCPVGNMTDVKNPKGLMSPETLECILQKATRECQVTDIGLFNWAEPLLHPRLPEMIRVVNKFGLNCHISTNLNKASGLEEIMLEKPFSIRISLSGFSQETYGITHKRGDIELVKRNMRLLADINMKTKVVNNISVAFHRYLSNLGDELSMKRYVEHLGFEFYPMWAVWLPLEKVLAKVGEEGYGTINDSDQLVIDNLALPLESALKAAKKNKNLHCKLQEDVITLDVLGRVQLCCGVYNSNRFTISSYMEKSIDEIQALRFAHPVCDVCRKYGVHDYYIYNIPNIDLLARREH